MSFPRTHISLKDIPKELEFKIVDWYDADEIIPNDDQGGFISKKNRKHDKEFVIYAFGVTKEGYSVCCKIKKYLPYFYMKIPENWNKKQIEDFRKNFLEYRLDDLEEEEEEDWNDQIENASKEMKPILQTRYQIEHQPYWRTSLIPSKIEVVEKEIFWTFTNGATYKFWKLYFKSKAGMRKFHAYLSRRQYYKLKTIKEKNTKMKLFESDLEPMLRFFHDKNIQPSNWMKLPMKSFKTKSQMSSSQINVEILWDKCIPIQKDSIPPLIVASFDIECDSATGDFPLAKKDYKKLANQLVVAYLTINQEISKCSKQSDKYNELNTLLKQNTYFFKTRIIQAFNNYLPVTHRKTNELFNEIAPIKLKSKFPMINGSKIEYFFKSEAFNKLCRKIYNICNRPIRKIKANQEMKAAVSYIENRCLKKEEELIENRKKFKINIDMLLDIIKSVSRSHHIEYNKLRDKIITKEVLVKYVNLELTRELPPVQGDSVIQIGTSFWIFGQDKPIYNHILTLGGCQKTEGINEIESVEYDEDTKMYKEWILLQKWTQMIKRYDPDILLGYNIFGFDELFMFDRAEELDNYKRSNKFKDYLNIGRFTSKELNKIPSGKGRLVDKKLASSALGSNYLYFFNMPGRVQIDLFKVIQGGLTKLPSYKLDNVAEFYISGKIISQDDKNPNLLKVANIKELDKGNYIKIIFKSTEEQLFGGDKIIISEIDYQNETILLSRNIPVDIVSKNAQWGISKDDVTPQQIFEYQNGNDHHRSLIAKYCIQDCALVTRLLKKLDTIPNNFGMSNVCLIPFSYIFMRGQGIKIFSLVTNECSKDGKVIPYLEKIKKGQTDAEDDYDDDDDDQQDLEEMDIDSYYPKKIIRNPVQSYYNESDSGIDDTFELEDNFNVIQMTDEGFEGAIVLKPMPGIYKEPITVLDFSSLYPSEIIAGNLSHDTICENNIWLGEKGAKRIRDLGYDFKDYTYDLFDWVDPSNKNKGKHKVGEKTSRFIQYPDGRKGLIPRIEMKLLGARKATKKRMENETDSFKISILDGLQLAYKVTANSLYGQLGASTSKLYKKAIAASTTAGGRDCIYKARDYCLANNVGCEVVYGDSIPENEMILIRLNFKTHIEYKFERIDYIHNNHFIIQKNYYSRTNKTTNTSNDKEYYRSLINIDTLTDNGWTPIQWMMRHKTEKDIYKITTTTGIVHVTADHSLILEDGNVIKPTNLKINQILLTCPLKKYDLTQSILNKMRINNFTYDNKYKTNPIDGLVLNIEIVKGINGIKPKYVYDLETVNHHFQAGYGNLIIHNTDSVFVKFNLKDEDGNIPITGTEKVQRSIDIGLALQAKLKEDRIFDAPHDLEYEKVFYPLMLITKKRYAGEKFDFDATKSKFTSMGIVLKRRDNAPILKYVYGGAINIIMKEQNINKAVKFVKDSCYEMLNDKFDLSMFVISKTLRDYYKDPESIAHKVLADRMAERDPGNKPACNERIPYAYIQLSSNKNKTAEKVLQGDKIEHIDYIKEHKLKVDYITYIENQLIKPISQIFELVLSEIKGYPYHSDYLVNLESIIYSKHNGNIKKYEEEFNKKKQAIVYKLIFKKIVNDAINKQNNVKSIEKWVVKEKIPKSIENNIENNIEDNEILNTNNTVIIKNSKQATLSSWFDSSLQKEYLTSKIESKKKKKHKSDPKNQMSLDSFFG